MRRLCACFAALAPAIHDFLRITGHQQDYSTVLEAEDAASPCPK